MINDKGKKEQETKIVTASKKESYQSGKAFLESFLSKSELLCPIDVDCRKICNCENELSSHRESVHRKDQWHCWDVMLSSDGEEGKIMKLENIEICLFSFLK